MGQEKYEVVREKSLYLLKELQVSLNRGQTEAYHELNKLLTNGIIDFRKQDGLTGAVSFSRLIRLIKEHLSEHQMVLLPREQELLLELSNLKDQLSSRSQLGFIL